MVDTTTRKVLSSYRMLLRHYLTIGVGERSKFAGVIVTDNLIDVIEARYMALGGRMKDLDLVDTEFNEIFED